MKINFQKRWNRHIDFCIRFPSLIKAHYTHTPLIGKWNSSLFSTRLDTIQKMFKAFVCICLMSIFVALRTSYFTLCFTDLIRWALLRFYRCFHFLKVPKKTLEVINKTVSFCWVYLLNWSVFGTPTTSV